MSAILTLLAAQVLSVLLGEPPDGLPARDTPLWRPSAVVVDQAGVIYIADDGSGTVRRIDAATGTAHIAVPGLRGPWAMAIGPGGALAVIDSRRNRILRIAQGQLPAVIAGNGTYGATGDGGAATLAQLGLPQGIAFDAAGNLYIADSDNGSIRRVDGRTGIIRTIAAGLQYPWGVAVDEKGNVFFAETRGNRVRKIDAATGALSTLATLDAPAGVALAPGGAVYAGQPGHIVRISPGGATTTVAGGGTARLAEADARPAAQVAIPGRIAQVFYTSRLLLFALPDDNIVAAVELKTGTFRIIAGDPRRVGDGSRSAIAELAQPRKLAVDGAGSVYIADSGRHRVLRHVAENGETTTLAGTGAAGIAIDTPHGLALDEKGSAYFTDKGTRVWKVEPAGLARVVAGSLDSGFAGDGGPATAALLNSAVALAAHAGTLYIADSGNRRVRAVDADEVIRTVAGTGEYGESADGAPLAKARFTWISDVLADGRGGLIVADLNADRVYGLDLKSGAIRTLLRVPSPRALAVARDGAIYVATAGRIYRNERVVFEGKFGMPDGLVVTADGDLLIADSLNNRIWRLRL